MCENGFFSFVQVFTCRSGSNCAAEIVHWSLRVFCFRWKGENVATSEVADILTMVHCILEANVYGVKVEGKLTRVINIKTLQSCLHFAFHISLIFQSRS